MSTQEKQIDLETVLQLYVEEISEPSPVTLKQWVRRYPQFERELMEFTITWNLVNTLPASAADQTDTQALVHRGMSVVQDVLNRLAQPALAPMQARPALKSMLKEAAALGLSATEFAKRVRMSVPLVTKLERRQIMLSSIPPHAIALIAEVLRQTADSVANYLDNPPMLAARASYKSKRAPAAAQQGFFEAVQDDPELDAGDRDYWASLEG